MIKKKFFIFSFISSIIAFVFCIFNINSYAYNTDSDFTNTITSWRDNTTQTNLSLESYTLDSSNYQHWYRIVYSGGFDNHNYVVLINFDFSNVTGVNLSQVNYNYNGNTNSYSTYYIYSPSGISNITFISNSGTSSEDSGSVFYFRIQNPNVIIKNIDIVNKNDLYLSYYYDTYITNLNNQIATLESNYQILTNQYTTLEGQYDTLENDYNSLQNNYNSLKNSYDAISVNLNPFQLDNISSVKMYLNDMLLDDGYQKFDGNSVSFDFYSMYYDDYWDSNTNNYFRIQVDLDGYSSFNAFESLDSLSDIETESVSMYFYNNSTQVDYWIQTDTDRNDDGITKFYTYGYSYNSYTIFFDLKPTQQASGYTHRISLLNTYDIGYSNGYKDGNNNGYTNGYKQGVSDSDMNLRGAYDDGYADGYKVYTDYLEDGTTYESIILSLATGPINIFKQIFNFEVLGANISILLTSVISLLITIWVIKRFLK